MAYIRPDSEGRTYIAMHVDGDTVIDLCGKKKIRLAPDDTVSHDNAFALFLAVSDYLTREGYFDPDMMDSSLERYDSVRKLLDGPISDED